MPLKAWVQFVRGKGGVGDRERSCVWTVLKLVVSTVRLPAV